ncbi:MAG: class I SAM-dependent methyltransferase [Actinomycetota bacterium]|nr:class I SAM-dependent methyltransferase [Actinomycetota bacterium]
MAKASRQMCQPWKVLNPPSQYADDTNLRARQRFWQHQSPPFNFLGWVLSLVDVNPSHRVLDVGCGNGDYLRAIAQHHNTVVGCDLSLGMLRAARCPTTICADICALPAADDAFQIVFAPHMLYHVADRKTAIDELRRVLTSGGALVAVTNGSGHIASMRACVEAAVQPSTPGWRMIDPAVRAFSLETGATQLKAAFSSVRCVRPDNRRQIVIRDSSIVADYVASTADYYQSEVVCPWPEVVDKVRRDVQRVIERHGAFVTSGDVGAFVCR